MMAQNNNSTKSGIILLIMGVFLLSSGCINPPELSFRPPSGNLVTCSDYPEIMDIWKEPGSYYVQVSGLGYPVSISKQQYDSWKIGQYIKRDVMGGWTPINLSKVNESESGFRDACVIT